MTNRRQFLRGILGGGAAAAVLSRLGIAPAQAVEPTNPGEFGRLYHWLKEREQYQLPQEWTDPDGTIFAVEQLAKTRDVEEFLFKAYDLERQIYFYARKEYPGHMLVAQGWTWADIVEDASYHFWYEFIPQYYRERFKEYGF